MEIGQKKLFKSITIQTERFSYERFMFLEIVDIINSGIDIDNNSDVPLMIDQGSKLSVIY